MLVSGSTECGLLVHVCISEPHIDIKCVHRVCLSVCLFVVVRHCLTCTSENEYSSRARLPVNEPHVCYSLVPRSIAERKDVWHIAYVVAVRMECCGC